MRVIGPDGRQIGILSRGEALKKAQEEDLDLVEIAPHAQPVVARIIDFDKFLYDQEKKARVERRKQKKGEQLKEIWLTPFIAKNDYLVRVGRIKEFLGEGAKVRIAIKPKRRLPDTKPLFLVMAKAIEELKEVSRVEQPPKMLGRQLVALVSPVKKKEVNNNEQQSEV